MGGVLCFNHLLNFSDMIHQTNTITETKNLKLSFDVCDCKRMFGSQAEIMSWDVGLWQIKNYQIHGQGKKPWSMAILVTSVCFPSSARNEHRSELGLNTQSPGSEMLGEKVQNYSDTHLESNQLSSKTSCAKESKSQTPPLAPQRCQQPHVDAFCMDQPNVFRFALQKWRHFKYPFLPWAGSAESSRGKRQMSETQTKTKWLGMPKQEVYPSRYLETRFKMKRKQRFFSLQGADNSTAIFIPSTIISHHT